MTQEEKELLLKDLCARLPYGFFVHRYSDNANIRIDDIDTFSRFLEYSESEEFKPYLRPMSSMTEEERIELSYTILQQPDLDAVRNLETISIELKELTKVLEWLNKKMFDYRGLIQMGLVLEAPEEMYNKTE